MKGEEKGHLHDLDLPPIPLYHRALFHQRAYPSRAHLAVLALQNERSVEVAAEAGAGAQVAVAVAVAALHQIVEIGGMREGGVVIPSMPTLCKYEVLQE
jgi:hypothetical protein